ncbi:S8 family serine peptidase [Candidatus Sulfidibacterium hydrothermale]|uniref:S8 family serine peptidase n=1 Tax=Candidatus Sulfidibacterium hydrothermale TaxID=2875962 RepID=UPI001F0B09FA|nr:S8 family serine peptidase [Candidatus Sulfidibacterium hydrothermale]UBM61157.1 S8 family serine peptidase [Candidatus Sulfidibacterium hydrothermale]
MKKVFLFLLLLLFTVVTAFAQIAPNKYYIQFTDKKNSPYSIEHPEEFLTARALARRARFHIPIKENDLPVNPQYVDSVAETGVKILNTSRWLNGVTVYTTDTALIDSIRHFSFVESTLKFAPVRNQKNKKRNKFEIEKQLPATSYRVGIKSSDTLEKLYGSAWTQINQINGTFLHEKGFRGEGMVIAVLDAGYSSVPTQPLFDSLRNDQRILGTKDFVNPGGDVYPPHYHGRMVLSCMAADDPGIMVGTAPKASYWLLRSEDAYTENVIEEYNWVSAAEFADSVGADIINSSLGYIDFDDTTFSHPYSDMNGHTCISTIGAEIAASKGILVVNSAGNSGQNTSFPWMGAPADGDSVLTAGAVTATGIRASFSSIGPTYDGRIKPTLMAMGESDAVADAVDSVVRASGTSFSSPVLAGMCACLWEAHPDATNMQIIEALKKTASLADSPNNLMGWGIPDFAQADAYLTQLLGIPVLKTTGKNFKVWPNPFTDGFSLETPPDLTGDVTVMLFSLEGEKVFSRTFRSGQSQLLVSDPVLARLPHGVYLLKLTGTGTVSYGKVIKR